MTCNCCSRNASSSLRCCCPPRDPAAALPAPTTWSTALPAASPSTCELSSSLHSGCQETCIEPTNCQRSGVVACQMPGVVACQMPCYNPRSSTPCSPCQGISAGSLGFGSSSYHSLGYGSRICFPGSFGSSGVRSLNYEVLEFPSLGCTNTLCYPIYLLFNAYEPSICVPTCAPRLSGISC